MDMEKVKDSRHEIAARAGFHAAANVLSLFEGAGVDGMKWPALGDAAKKHTADRLCGDLAEFVRANPQAPPESLYRFARGRDFHSGPSEAFDHQPVAYRLAFETFSSVVLMMERAIDAEIARAASVKQTNGGLIPAAALSERPEDTTLEHQPDPLALNENMRLTQPGRPDDGNAPAAASDPSSPAANEPETTAPQEPAPVAPEPTKPAEPATPAPKAKPHASKGKTKAQRKR